MTRPLNLHNSPASDAATHPSYAFMPPPFAYSTIGHFCTIRVRRAAGGAQHDGTLVARLLADAGGQAATLLRPRLVENSTTRLHWID